LDTPAKHDIKMQKGGSAIAPGLSEYWLAIATPRHRRRYTHNVIVAVADFMCCL